MPASRQTPKPLLGREDLQALLGHDSPLVRRWAVRALRDAFGTSALAEAIPFALRERHPDVLEQYASWCEDIDSPEWTASVLPFARWLRKHAGSRRWRPVALTLWGLQRGSEYRGELLDLIAPGPKALQALARLLQSCPGPELAARAREALAEDEDGETALELDFLGPDDPARAVHWRLAVGSYARGVPRWRRWNYLASLLPARAEGAGEGEARPAELAPLAEALERGAGRLAESVAAGGFPDPRLAPLADGARAVLRDAGLLAAELAKALRWRLAAGGEVPDADALAAHLEANAAWLEAAAGEAGRLWRAKTPADAALAAALSSWPLDERLSSAILEALPPQERDAFAAELAAKAGPGELPPRAQARALDLFGRLRGEDAAPELGRRVAEGAPFEVEEACLYRLKAIGPAVLEGLEPLLDAAAGEGLGDLLEVFAAFPGERAGRIVAARGARLFRELELWEAAEALERTGGLAAIDALSDAYRPGEPLIGEALLTLAELHGIELPDAAGLRRERALDIQRRARARAAAGADPVRIELRCLACGYPYYYEVGEFRFAVDYVRKSAPIADSLSFDRLIRCKRCGAVEDYGLTEGSALRVEDELEEALALRAEAKAADEEDEPGGILFGRARLMRAMAAGGSLYGCAREALKALRGRVAAQPREAEGWRRLGNLYAHGGLSDLAEEAFGRAVAADPGEIEAHLGLAELLLKGERPAAAHPHYHAVLRHARGYRQLPREDKWDIVRHALDCLQEIHLATRLPFLPEEPGTSPPEPAAGLRIIGPEAVEERLDRLADRYCGAE